MDPKNQLSLRALVGFDHCAPPVLDPSTAVVPSGINGIYAILSEGKHNNNDNNNNNNNNNANDNNMITEAHTVVNTPIWSPNAPTAVVRGISGNIAWAGMCFLLQIYEYAVDDRLSIDATFTCFSSGSKNIGKPLFSPLWAYIVGATVTASTWYPGICPRPRALDAMIGDDGMNTMVLLFLLQPGN